MKNIKIRLVLLLFLLLVIQQNASSQNGQLIIKTIPAPSLQNNLFGTPASQKIAIYLPRNYNTSSKRYPTAFFLPGYGDPIEAFIYGYYQGYRLKNSMDTLINSGAIKEMIVVIPTGINFMEGSFYANSPTIGNWGNFIALDIVHYIDSLYRTLPVAASRGISGHSMGGFGALNLAMIHPDIFGSTYGFAPGLFDPNGLSNTVMFSDTGRINNYLAKESVFDSMTYQGALTDFNNLIDSLKSVGNWDWLFTYAYGSAFSFNANRNAPFIDYPYKKINGTLVRDTVIWKRWESGFGNLAEKIMFYKNNLLQLRAITFDYGINDEFTWIPQGCEYFSDLLELQGIFHQLIPFDGGHNDKVRDRIENHIMPFFSTTLVDTQTTSIQEKDHTIKKTFELSNYPNPFNPLTTIQYDIPYSSKVSIVVYDILGNELVTLINEEKNAGTYQVIFDGSGLSSGVYFYRLNADGFIQTKKLILLR